MNTHAKNRQAGFTLIEYIVALVVAAIVASMVYTFFGSALTQSSIPIERLRQVSNLHQVMENIVADYNRLNALNLRYNWQASTPYGLDSVVIPTTINGHYYKCTIAGTSGGTEPSWPINGTEISDSGVTWKDSGNIIWQKNHTYSNGDIVVPIKNNGHYYITAGGSNTTEPDWKTTPGGVTTVAGATWTEAGTILAKNVTAPSNAVLDDNLYKHLTTSNGDRYGTGYTLVAADTKFIKFSSNSEADATGSDEQNILKVTIKSNYSAETLMQIFTIR
jgi:prepilin-type N-terminal cleavage/methylation domain-containing protein